jgi:hypothetical protein
MTEDELLTVTFTGAPDPTGVQADNRAFIKAKVLK